MPADRLLETQITIALKLLRKARFAGNHKEIDAAEQHLDRLLDRLEAVPA